MTRAWRKAGSVALAGLTLFIGHERATDARAARLAGDAVGIGIGVDAASPASSTSVNDPSLASADVPDLETALNAADAEDTIDAAVDEPVRVDIDANPADAISVPDPAALSAVQTASAPGADASELLEVPDPASLQRLALAQTDEPIVAPASAPSEETARASASSSDADAASSDNADNSSGDQASAVLPPDAPVRIKPDEDDSVAEAVEETPPAALSDALSQRLEFPYRRLEDIDFTRRANTRYPSDCRDRAAAEEAVIIRFKINARGRSIDEEVAASTNECFDDAAMRVIRRSRFNTIRLARENFQVGEDEVILAIPFSK